MTMAETVIQELKKEMKAGATQTYIAKKHNFPVSAMRRILVGETKVDDISIGRIQVMFPDATINLNGTASVATATATSGIAIAGNGNTATQGGGIEDFRSRVISALIDSDIEPGSLKSALKIINSL